MSDALLDLIDEVGSEVVGPLWMTQRGKVKAYLRENPLKVRRWRQAIRDAVEEGRL